MMLIQFSFKNFKSFRDDTVLDFTATKITENSESVITVGRDKILPVTAIYGANASGKSNVIEAFRFMTNYVKDSFSYGGETGNDRINHNTQELSYTPFLFDEKSSKGESSFEVYFIDAEDNNEKTYNYGFTLDQQGVVEEWLNTKAKTARQYRQIFYRHFEEIETPGLSSKNKELIHMSLNRETLVVSLGAKLKIIKLKNIQEWFYKSNFADFGNPIENVYLSTSLPKNFTEDKAVRNNIIRYFAAFDPSIVGFKYEELKDKNDQSNLVKIDAIHKTADGKEISIPLQEESRGTLKMFALYQDLVDTLNKGGILFLDELSAHLHPLLVRDFLITFIDPAINKKHSQIVFTSHDTWLFSNNFLRRDEIWFTEKDQSGVSTLYSLADFENEGKKIRKDENYEKNYLLGKYGAVPSLKNFDMLKEDK